MKENFTYKEIERFDIFLIINQIGREKSENFLMTRFAFCRFC